MDNGPAHFRTYELLYFFVSLKKVSSRILKILLKTLPLKEASNIAAQITGWRKNELYEIGLTLK